MKKLLISLLIGTSILGISCGNKSVEDKSTTKNVEVAETNTDDSEKREEFLQKVEDYMQGVADNYNKKYVEDKVEVRRECDNLSYAVW